MVALNEQIIRVDREIRPEPSLCEIIFHPDLNNTGPSEYDVTHLSFWIHESQKPDSTCNGHDGFNIWDDLIKRDILKQCMSLVDAQEIQKKGVVFFQQHFGNKMLYFWKSITRFTGGNFKIPYLYVDAQHDEVILDWYEIGEAWDTNRVAPCFPE